MTLVEEVIKIKDKINSKITFNEDLSKFSWFNLGGSAKIVFRPNSLKDLSFFLKKINTNKQIKVLGQERMAQKEDLLFPILSSMIHNDKEIRTEVAFGSERIYLDISFKQYANLDDDKNVGETTFIF